MSSNTTGPGRIVVGVDGSVPGNEALRWAARLAPTLGATIQVVSAWQYPSADALIPIPSLDWEQINRETVEASLHEVFGDRRPDGLDVVLTPGHPARTLLDAGRVATMIIVGSRGLGGFTGLLLGSVSRNVAEHATCPVLVVHDPHRTKE